MACYDCHDSLNYRRCKGTKSSLPRWFRGGVLDMMQRDAQKDPEVFPCALHARALLSQLYWCPASDQMEIERTWSYIG
ncbi:hypothetical protein MLD38_036863 [Melastoma candidum]|uniref:Uncharacterized protein n=1 Tax=Melastoma candidum TaxID=119954 RepID=A0ACB9LMV6_9MYRT|nr:hypothetical protein MLD38_036863 [Melastoma candidum]